MPRQSNSGQEVQTYNCSRNVYFKQKAKKSYCLIKTRLQGIPKVKGSGIVSIEIIPRLNAYKVACQYYAQ